MITQKEKQSFYRDFQRLKSDIIRFEEQRHRGELLAENCELNILIVRAQQLDLYDLSDDDDEVDKMHQLRTRVREFLLKREYLSMYAEHLGFDFSPRIRFSRSKDETQTEERSVSPDPLRPVSQRDEFLRDFWLLERDVADFRQQSNVKRFTSTRIEPTNDLNYLNRCINYYQSYNRDLTVYIARVEALERFDLSRDDDGHLSVMRVRRSQLHDDLNLLNHEIKRRHHELQYYLGLKSSLKNSVDSQDAANSRRDHLNTKPIKPKKRVYKAVSNGFFMRAMAHPALQAVVAAMLCVGAVLAFSFGHMRIGYTSLLCGLGLFASSARESSTTGFANLFSPPSSPTPSRP